MKLLVINPLVSPPFNEMMKEALSRRLDTAAELTVIGLTEGPACIEGFADEVLAAPQVLSIVEREKDNYDGFFINCFGDVAMDALREITDKPIVGAGEAAYFMAGAVGVPFSIVTIGSNARNKNGYRFKEMGCCRFVSTAGIEEGVLALNDDPKETARHIAEAFLKEKEQKGSELLVLGCTGMIDVAAMVKEILGTPVIEPCTAGIKLLESFVSLGISHCRGGKYTPCEPKMLKLED